MSDISLRLLKTIHKFYVSQKFVKLIKKKGTKGFLIRHCTLTTLNRHNQQKSPDYILLVHAREKTHASNTKVLLRMILVDPNYKLIHS